MRSSDGCYEFRRKRPGEYYCKALGLYALRTGRNVWSLEFPFLTNTYFRIPGQSRISTSLAGFSTLREALSFPIYDSIVSASCDDAAWMRSFQALPKAAFA